MSYYLIHWNAVLEVVFSNWSLEKKIAIILSRFYGNEQSQELSTL